MKRILAIMLITIVIVLILIIGVQWMRDRSTPDPVRIVSLIDRTRVSLERRDTASIMASLHEDFSAFGNNREQTRMQLFGWFRQGYRLRLAVTVDDTSIQGDTARVTLKASGDVRSEGGRTAFSVPAVLTLRRIPARYMLVLPTHTWKITGLETTLPNEFAP